MSFMSISVINRSKKVLLVDDNRVNRLVAGNLLQRWGYKKELATNGSEAIKLAALGVFDLILMNLNMPGMNGGEAAALIRGLSAHYQFLPIIALSANSRQLQQSYEPFTDFLEVPYMPEQLKSLLQQHLPETGLIDSYRLIQNKLDAISSNDIVYRRQLVSLFAKNCAELIEDLQMGRLESPAYLNQVRHKHQSSLRLLDLYSLEAALDNLQEALEYQGHDQALLELRKQAVAQHAGAFLEELSLLVA